MGVLQVGLSGGRDISKGGRKGMSSGRREATWHKVSQGQEASGRRWFLFTQEALGSGSGSLSILTVEKVDKWALPWLEGYTLFRFLVSPASVWTSADLNTLAGISSSPPPLPYCPLLFRDTASLLQRTVHPLHVHPPAPHSTPRTTTTWEARSSSCLAWAHLPQHPLWAQTQTAVMTEGPIPALCPVALLSPLSAFGPCVVILLEHLMRSCRCGAAAQSSRLVSQRGLCCPPT